MTLTELIRALLPPAWPYCQQSGVTRGLLLSQGKRLLEYNPKHTQQFEAPN